MIGQTLMQRKFESDNDKSRGLYCMIPCQIRMPKGEFALSGVDLERARMLAWYGRVALPDR